jgi:uncharacterized protein YjbJ (UPF0337 family)
MKKKDRRKSRLLGRFKGTRGTTSATQVLLHKMGHPLKWDQVKFNWAEYRVQVKSQWDKLTDHELIKIQGDETEVCQRIQERYSIPRADAKQQMQDFLIALNKA